jgi:hypothetical protein
MISSVDAVACLATHPSPLLIFEMKFREDSSQFQSVDGSHSHYECTLIADTKGATIDLISR